MKLRQHVLLLYCILTVTTEVLGQTTYSSHCYINTYYSADSSHYMVSVPYDNILETTVGKTVVYSTDSVKMYEMDRHFDTDSYGYKVFLSNDASTIVYLVNREYEWDGVKVPTMQMYKYGVPFRHYNITDLVSCDEQKENCYLFYAPALDSLFSKDDIRVMIYKKPAFVENDTLYILSFKEELLRISLNTGYFNSLPLSSIDWNWFKQVPQAKVIVNKSEHSSKDLPDMLNGQSFAQGLADYLDMKLLSHDQQYDPKFDKFKQYFIDIEVITDKNGNATLEKESQSTDLPLEKVKAFVDQTRFQYKGYPEEAERWRSSERVVLMNKSRKRAKIERQKEIKENNAYYLKRLDADSINGQYIPLNLEECFTELNKILKEKDIENIRQLPSGSETIRFHHGFGMWLRNNWGLWGGSRLQSYFIDRGITHPDRMSGSLLLYYYDWLNGRNEGWKEFDKKGILIQNFRLPETIWIRDIYQSPWSSHIEYYYTLLQKNDKYRVYKAYVENHKLVYKNRYIGKIDTILLSNFAKFALSDTTFHFHYDDFANVFTPENASAFIEEHGPNHWLRTDIQKSFIYDEITQPDNVEKNLQMYYDFKADQSGWIDGASSEIAVIFPFGETQLKIKTSSNIEYALPISVNGQFHYNPEISRMLLQLLPKSKNHRTEQITGKTLHINLTKEVINTYSRKLEALEGLAYQQVTDTLKRYFKVTNLHISNSTYSTNWNGEKRYCCQLWNPDGKFNLSILYSSEIENSRVKYSPENIIRDYTYLVNKLLSVDFFREFLAANSKRKISIIYDDTTCFTTKTKEGILRNHPGNIDFTKSLFITVCDEEDDLSNWVILPDNRYFLSYNVSGTPVMPIGDEKFIGNQ